MDPGGCKVLEGEGVNTGSVVNSKITSSLTHIHQLTPGVALRVFIAIALWL